MPAGFTESKVLARTGVMLAGITALRTVTPLSPDRALGLGASFAITDFTGVMPAGLHEPVTCLRTFLAIPLASDYFLSPDGWLGCAVELPP
jgi:hypothetical protein